MITELGRELCELLDQQMTAIAGRGVRDLTPGELADYEQRRTRIATILSEARGSQAKPGLVSVRSRGQRA